MRVRVLPRLSRFMTTSTDKRSLYVQLAELPVPVSARFVQPNVIQVTSNIKDHVQNLKRSSTQTLFVLPSSVTFSTSSLDSPDIVKSIFSKSGTRKAVLRDVACAKTRFVEVWNRDRLEASFQVDKLHGPFYTDGGIDYLSSLTFSPSERVLVYTAEANAPKDEDGDFARFRFTPQFGEGVAGKKRPTLFVFRYGDEGSSVDALEMPPNGTMYGQATFSTESTLYATGYRHTNEGRILGVKGCYNRPTSIWEITLAVDGVQCAVKNINVTPGELAGRAPKVEGGKLYWLANTIGGAHAKSVSLHAMDLETQRQSTIVDIVQDPRQRDDGFPGLYPDTQLPTETFVKLGGETTIVSHSTWGSRQVVLLVSENGVQPLTDPLDEKLYSWTVLCTDGESQVLCARSAPTIPHELVLGKVAVNTAGKAKVDWRVISETSLLPHVKAALATLQASVISIPEQYPTETIVVGVKGSAQSTPCITAPHGGPHGTTMTSFTPSTTALALQGYTISSPNYTGSLGFGEAFVTKLLGRCGTLDVEDCIATTRHLIKLGISEEGPGKQFVQGGSHGGFLTGHLIGQYPEMYSAAILRNPVVSAEISTSDIEEWYYEEFGITYFNRTAPLMTPDIFNVMYKASPLAYIDKVKTPALLLIGVADQRVAPTQGVGYYHALKGRGVEVDMLMFEGESHPLDGVEASKVGWEAGLAWLDKRARK